MARKQAIADASWLTQQDYAHRGLHGAGVPENSLAAFAAALMAGMGIECDVRKSFDGRAIVFHDEDLERLTGESGPFAQRNVAELTGMTLLGSTERIPTLRDMLEQVAGQMPVLLELKTFADRPVDQLCRAVRRDLEGYIGHVAVMSFDPRVSQWFNRKMPGMLRGLVISERNSRTLIGALKRQWTVRRARPHFIAYDITDLAGSPARRMAKAGFPLLTWTVRTQAQRAEALAFGATPICEGAGIAAQGERSAAVISRLARDGIT